jgi:hypothetical protein
MPRLVPLVVPGSESTKRLSLILPPVPPAVYRVVETYPHADGGREGGGLGGNRASDAALVGASAKLNDRGSRGELQDRNATAFGRHDGVDLDWSIAFKEARHESPQSRRRPEWATADPRLRLAGRTVRQCDAPGDPRRDTLPRYGVAVCSRQGSGC